MHPIMDGGDVRSLVGEGPLIRRSSLLPYKFSRAGDCFPSLKEIPEVAVWHTRPGSDGQHNCNALSEQDGRDQVQELGPQSPGDHSVVSASNYSVGSPYFRL